MTGPANLHLVAQLNPAQASIPAQQAPPVLPPREPPADHLAHGNDGCCANCLTLAFDWIKSILFRCWTAVRSCLVDLCRCCCMPSALREARRIQEYIHWIEQSPELPTREEMYARLRALPRRINQTVRFEVARNHMREIEELVAGYQNEERKAVPRRGDERPMPTPPLPATAQLQGRAITEFISQNPGHPTIIAALQQSLLI